jgi:hypothetical protein
MIVAPQLPPSRATEASPLPRKTPSVRVSACVPPKAPASAAACAYAKPRRPQLKTRTYDAHLRGRSTELSSARDDDPIVIRVATRGGSHANVGLRGKSARFTTVRLRKPHRRPKAKAGQRPRFGAALRSVGGGGRGAARFV